MSDVEKFEQTLMDYFDMFLLCLMVEMFQLKAGIEGTKFVS